MLPSRRAWIGWTLIALFFAAIAVVDTYPLALKPSSTIGVHGDAYFSVWRLAWIAHQLRTDPLHLFDANIYYPERATLAYSDAMLLPGVVLAPFAWAGADALAIYNLTLLASFVLNAMAACVVVRYLTGSTTAGLIGGLIFGFAPHRFDHFNHLEIQFAFWIPLAAYAWHRAVAADRARSYFRVGALLAFQVLSCIYYALFLLIWITVITVARFARSLRTAVAPAAAMLLPPLIVLALYSMPYLANRSRLGDRNPRDVANYSALPTDFLSAPPSTVLYRWTSPLSVHERHLFPGFLALLLVVCGLWPPLDRVRRLHAIGLAIAILLTLGTNGYVYSLLYDWVLPFRGLRVPARANVLVLLEGAVLAGFGTVRLLSTVKHSKAALTLATCLVAGMSVEYFARPPLKNVDRRISAWYPWLRHMDGAVIFEWPVTVPWRLDDMVDVEYMYRSTHHWRPLVNGYSGNYPRSYIDLLMAMRTFPDTGSLELLRQVGANILIVHEVEGSSPSYKYAIDRLGRDPNVRVFATDKDRGDRVTFFRLETGPANTTGGK
jgi:hypothetical protein